MGRDRVLDTAHKMGEVQSTELARVVYSSIPKSLSIATTIMRFLVLLGSATAVAAQFNFAHTQYDTSPPVYPSRELVRAHWT
jgi:hypothetical protein